MMGYYLSMTESLPNKIKDDAIVEALLEIQFQSDDIGEVVIGRLSDIDELASYTTNRLGTSNIPEALRDSDPQLRFQPVIEKRAKDEKSTVRIGSHVLSYHVYAPYLGGEQFEQKLSSIINILVNKTTNFQATRLGFRYINFLQSKKHHITSIDDLTLTIQLNEQRLTSGVNLAYVSSPAEAHNTMLRVATPDFMTEKNIPDDLVCIADIDVHTPAGFIASDAESVMQWVKEAHELEKQSFFSLFNKKLIEELREE